MELCTKCGKSVWGPYERDLMAFSVMVDKRGKVPAEKDVAEQHNRHTKWCIHYCSKHYLCDCHLTNDHQD